MTSALCRVETCRFRQRTDRRSNEHLRTDCHCLAAERRGGRRPPHSEIRVSPRAFWDLGPDEALVIETDIPRARYWGLQLATLGWFEQVDPIQRITSINQHQAIPGQDGRIRFVIAHADPGVPNWLDTAEHRDGLLTYRWFWPEMDPTPTSRVVKLADVRNVLPAKTATIDAQARRDEIRTRKQHLAWRFRT